MRDRSFRGGGLAAGVDEDHPVKAKIGLERLVKDASYVRAEVLVQIAIRLSVETCAATSDKHLLSW